MTFRARFTLALMILSSVLCCCRNLAMGQPLALRDATEVHFCCAKPPVAVDQKNKHSHETEKPCEECPFLSIRANSIVVNTTAPALDPIELSFIADLLAVELPATLCRTLGQPVVLDTSPPTLLSLHTCLLC